MNIVNWAGIIASKDGEDVRILFTKRKEELELEKAKFTIKRHPGELQYTFHKRAIKTLIELYKQGGY